MKKTGDIIYGDLESVHRLDTYLPDRSASIFQKKIDKRRKMVYHILRDNEGCYASRTRTEVRFAPANPIRLRVCECYYTSQMRREPPNRV